jgi:hypothetical protein
MRRRGEASRSVRRQVPLNNRPNQATTVAQLSRSRRLPKGRQRPFPAFERAEQPCALSV